jgi:hypothetical protein
VVKDDRLAQVGQILDRQKYQAPPSTAALADTAMVSDGVKPETQQEFEFVGQVLASHEVKPG